MTVKLRRLEPGDTDAVHALLSNIDVVRYTLFPLHSAGDSEKFVRDACKSHACAIADEAGGPPIGLGGVAVPAGSEQGELWYLVDPRHWGRGIATEAARQLLSFGFGELRLHRLWASCVPANPASARVLEKLGMTRKGCLSKNLCVDGEWKDCVVYAMLREEWKDQSWKRCS